MSYDPLRFIDEIALKSRDDELIPDPEQGIGRECHAFTATERRVQMRAEAVARDLLKGHAEGEDYRIRRSAAGSLIVTYFGRQRGLKAVVVHSHLDSVPNGGKYDGVAGVAWAFSVLDEIARMPVKPLRSLKVIAWVSEESSPKNGVGCLGSAIATGTISHEALDKIEYEPGMLLKDHLADRWDAIRTEIYEPTISTRNTECAYELHIEQGTCIARSGKDIGIVVSGIGGARRLKYDRHAESRHIDPDYRHRFTLRFLGVSDHTGATPPNRQITGGELSRKDALVAASYCLARFFHAHPTRLIRLDQHGGIGFTSVPAIVIVEVAVGGENRAVRASLNDMIDAAKRCFGVNLQWRDGACGETAVGNDALPAMDFPFLVSCAASEALGREGGYGTTRATVTDFHLTPTRVAFKVDMREVNPQHLSVLHERIDGHIKKLFGGHDGFVRVSEKVSQPVDSSLLEGLRRAAADLGISYAELPSHAGQDSDRLAAAGIPVAMCFIRQEDGISHSPFERMEAADFESASRVMTRAVLTSLTKE